MKASKEEYRGVVRFLVTEEAKTRKVYCHMLAVYGEQHVPDKSVLVVNNN